MHSLFQGRAQMGASGFGPYRQQPDTMDGRSGLSTGEPVRDQQADATCQ
jgi:hypothetical protein